MGRWRVSWGARNLSVLLAWPPARTRLPSWFRATASSVLMGVSPDMAAGSPGSAGCLFMRVSLWRSLQQDKSQKRHESPERGCWVCGRAFLEAEKHTLVEVFRIEDFSQRTPFARFSADTLSPKIDVAERKDAINVMAESCQASMRRISN